MVWLAVKEIYFNEIRIKPSKSTDIVLQKNSYNKYYKVLNDKLSILQIVENSKSTDARQHPYLVNNKEKFEDKYTKFISVHKTYIEFWESFKTKARNEINRIKKEIEKNPNYIYLPPYSELIVYDTFTEKITGIKQEPAVNWKDVKDTIISK